MTDDTTAQSTPPLDPQWIEAAALAISVYDWDNNLSGNGEISDHQRAEAVAAITAAAPLIAARAAEAIATAQQKWIHGNLPELEGGWVAGSLLAIARASGTTSGVTQ